MPDWRLNEAEDQIIELETELDTMREKYDDLMLDLQSTACSLDDSQKEITRLKAQLKVRADLAKTQKELVGQLRDNNRALQKMLRENKIEVPAGLLFDASDFSRVSSIASYWRDRARRAEAQDTIIVDGQPYRGFVTDRTEEPFGTTWGRVIIQGRNLHAFYVTELGIWQVPTHVEVNGKKVKTTYLKGKD